MGYEVDERGTASGPEIDSLVSILRDAMKIPDSQEVVIVAWDRSADNAIGIRITEISVHDHRGGFSYMQSNADLGTFALLFACERYLLSANEEPYRPEGWESDIDERADAEWALREIITQLAEGGN